jgi:hypothetical protein
MNKNLTILLLVFAAGCSGLQQGFGPEMDPDRKISEQDCSKPVDTGGGNLLCMDEAQRRARLAGEERQARTRREAMERAERERLERERAAQLAAEEAARKQRAAEEERLAAERRRLEAEAAAAAAAARKAQEERERQEKLEAEARERQRAEQEAREAAERECRRLEQERSDGRAALESFVGTYGKVDEFKEIAGQITAFLGRASKPKPCPPAPR